MPLRLGELQVECDDLSRRSKGFPFLPLKTNGCLIFKSGPSRFPGFWVARFSGFAGLRLAWTVGVGFIIYLIGSAYTNYLLNVPLAG